MTKSPPPSTPIKRRMQKQGPLSYSQESLWFLQQLDPESSVYNSTLLIKFTGGIDQPSLEQALNELVRRHESLRTQYLNQRGRPVQVIQPFEPFSLPIVNYYDLPEEVKEQAIQRYISEQSNQPFDLHRGPLIRFAHLHTDQYVDYLFFCTHHINYDGWSQQIFISELMQLYDAISSGKNTILPELPIQYVDYALWQREWLSGETLTAYIEHWKNMLSGDLPIVQLHTDRARPTVQTHSGATYALILPWALSSQVKVFCQRERITTFHLFLAAYALLLMRYSGQDDIIMGCPFANRDRSELDGLVGMFVNTLPIRVNLSGNPSVRELLDQVRAVMLDAFIWQAAPFETLVSEISPERDISRTPIFHVTINLINVPKQPQTIVEGLKVENIRRVTDHAPFDLSLEFNTGEDGSLTASWTYNVDLYDEKTIIRMASHYQNLLRELMAKTDLPIAELEMLTPSEQKRIVVDWNNTNLEYPRSKTIQQLFEEQVAFTPNAPALVFFDQVLTYEELNVRANQLAHALSEMGVHPEVRVGIYVERSVEMIVSLLAILKAGGAYVPLDPAYPSERLSFILKDTATPILLTLQRHMPELPTYDGKVVCIDDEYLYTGRSEENPNVAVASENLAYVMYTSGSTGLPKGSCIPHRAVVRLVKNTNYVDFNAKEVFLQFAPLAFDASTFEIWGSLLNGAKLVVFPPHLPNLDELTKFVQTSGVTTLWLTAGLFQQVMEWHPEIVDHLHQFLSGGDVISPRHVRLGLEQNPRCRFINGYGPTENTTFTCCYTVKDLQDVEQSVPIGRPIANTSVYILDRYRKPVPVGVVGEIYTGGDGLSRGYINQPELTEQKFVPDPFHAQTGGRLYRTGDYGRWLPDGNIEFVGRMDNQVKIRGFRIELGEIENTLKEYSGIQESVVMLREDQPGDKRLVGYIIPSKGTTLDWGQLRDYLKGRLPGYMIPVAFVFMDAFPLTINGKIDRLALPPPENRKEQEEYLSPRSHIESRLVSIWQEILGIERVGIRDNFFELGGDSLMAVRLFALIQEEFKQSLPLVLLFQDGTIETIAASLIDQEHLTLRQGINPIQKEGTEIPLFIIAAGLRMRELTLALAPSRPVFVLNPVENGKMVYRESIQETAKILYHNLVDIYPEGPYLLAGHSGYGYFVLELSRLLIQNGQKVAFIGLLDTFPPYYKSEKITLNDRVRFHFAKLQHKNPLEILQYIGQGIQRFSNRWRRRVMKAKMIERNEKEGQVEQVRDPFVPCDQKLEQLEEIRMMLIHAYKPEPFIGPVTIFSTTNPDLDIRGDPMEQWANTIGCGFNIIRISGDHFTMLQPPHVAVLAEKINALLPHHENDGLGSTIASEA